MSHSEPKELIGVEELIEKGNYIEALQILDDLEIQNILPPQEKLPSNYLRSLCLSRLGQDEKALILAEQVYEESKNLKNPIQTFDASMIMAESLSFLVKIEEASIIISISENLLKTISQIPEKEYTAKRAYVTYIKSLIYLRRGELETALDNIKQTITLQENINQKQDIARTLYGQGAIFAHKGELDQAKECAEKGLELEKGGFNRNIVRNYMVLGVTNSHRGDFDRSNENWKSGLIIAEKINDIVDIALITNNIGMNYLVQGDFPNAQVYLKKALLNLEKMNAFGVIPSVLDSLIHLNLDMGDIEQARQYLRYMKQINDREENKATDTYYRVDKAVILKTSSRAINRGKAEEILKQVVDDEIVDYEMTIIAFLNLCDLLLIELRNTEDLEVLDELRSYLSRLLDIAENNHAYLLLAESYLFQARLSLIDLDIKEARRFFTQSMQIAERWNFDQLAAIVASEYAELLNQLSIWEKYKETNASLAERIKLARIEDQMLRMLRNRMSLMAQITEEKISVHKERKICIVCKGDVERFNIYICPECNGIYCQKCARALTELENICWACNTPIDPSKPIILEAQEEEKEKIKISSKKDVKGSKE
jgi:tetratricopeptide (TPR) repeat protein